MKQFILWFLLLPFTAGAQIALENTYNNGGTSYRTGIVHLSLSGYKYAQYDINMITLYNMNHSVFRQIPIPPLPVYSSFSVRFISEELFDTNPATIEYLVTANLSNSANDPIIRIFDETGNILFARDSANLVHQVNYEIISRGIIQTSAGVKMTLGIMGSPHTEVYSLPGILPCEVCSSGVLTGIAPYAGNAKVETAQHYYSLVPSQATSLFPINCLQVNEWAN